MLTYLAWGIPSSFRQEKFSSPKQFALQLPPMAESRFQILSDLHLESPSAYDIFHIEPKAPYLVLGGDIGYVKDDGFFNFLRRQLGFFRLVFLVLGNHEPYHSTWPEAKSRIKRFEADLASCKESEMRGQFVFLDQTRYDISPTISVLGCTLFSEVAQEQEERVSFGLNDFYHIGNWSVEAHREAHRADLHWLNYEIDSISRFEPERKVAVFIHYCPLTVKNVVDPKHEDSTFHRRCRNPGRVKESKPRKKPQHLGCARNKGFVRTVHDHGLGQLMGVERPKHLKYAETAQTGKARIRQISTARQISCTTISQNFR